MKGNHEKHRFRDHFECVTFGAFRAFNLKGHNVSDADEFSGD